MSWLKNIFSKLIPTRPPSNLNTGKPFDEIYDDLGLFTYTDTGFTISYEDFSKTLNWSDIIEINVYKTDLITTDRVDMQIVLGEGAFIIHEELPGWFQFVLKTKEVFPSIPKEWDIEIIQPAFAANYRTIYKKEQ